MKNIYSPYCQQKLGTLDVFLSDNKKQCRGVSSRHVCRYDYISQTKHILYQVDSKFLINHSRIYSQLTCYMLHLCNGKYVPSILQPFIIDAPS